MIVTYGVLGLAVFIEVILIISIFSFTTNNVEDTLQNKIIINSSELIVLLAASILSIYQTIKNFTDPMVMGFLILFTSVIIIIIWAFLRIEWLRKAVGLNIGISRPNNRVVFNNHRASNNNNNNNNNNDNNNTQRVETQPKQRSDKNEVVLSKYIDRDMENNFSFHDLYPSYNDKSSELRVKGGSTDYSAYNGYPEEHICHGCGCMKREDGYTYCGKFIPGMGAIGCSDRWGCLNCRKCKKGRNNKNNKNKKDYSCDNCKCHNTDAGYICGKIDRTKGYVHKCNSSCEKCDECYGADSGNFSNDLGMITVKQTSSLNDVKQYDNISNSEPALF